jgi:hypothetical protein
VLVVALFLSSVRRAVFNRVTTHFRVYADRSSPLWKPRELAGRGQCTGETFPFVPETTGARRVTEAEKKLLATS